MLTGYYDKFGLLNSKKDEVGAENSLLWTFQNYLLNKEAGNHQEAERIKGILIRNMDNCRIEEGLFYQTPVHTTNLPDNRDKYMSPDQLITFFMVGYLFDYDKAVFHSEIWEQIKYQGYFKYNNIPGDTKLRFIHPRDLVLYYSLNSGVLGQIAMILLLIANIVACNSERQKTSGKLLAWTKMMALKDKFWAMRISWSICTKIVNKTHGSWADVFKIYFPLENHPNADLAYNLYNKQ